MPVLPHLPVPDLGEVYFNRQTRHLTISENLQQHYSFDLAGRFLTGFLNGVNYRRGLDSTILRKQLTASATKMFHRLSETENRALIDDVQGRVAQIAEQVARSDRADLLSQLRTILSWDYTRLAQERAIFHDTYKPISILPPDQYLSIVLQAAEGCSWNQCTFCTFYRDRKFCIKCPSDFRLHIQKIKDLLGGSIGLRKSIFLGDANALIIPQRRLVDLLQVVHDEFPLESSKAGDDYTLKGIYSFLDIFGAERKTLDDYRELATYGLKRIYIGLETGDDELFALLNKPGAPQACVDAVRTIKQAGIAIGVILLAGAGGDRFATQHVAQSIARIQAMELGQDDIVYVSPLVGAGADEYVLPLRERGGRDLSHSAIQQQVATFKAALRPTRAAGPQVSLYRIEEFIY